ncbi:cell division topological specificity factor MinE [Megamonas rupellensis]|uniref:cell division topological specificity factor MinE n=1 Tax=Megamonas rupellensis TaxID=491921 RepID=UPI00195B9BDE|nr:cell division topological specificity factor MinE [Megamonas rupellensis]MBM6748269.1 cell division topological specificity factor MinE [Megamonas rupellensis]
MFEVVMKLLNRNQKTSKEIAKDRLKVVLIHDRANISPEVMQALKNDIIEVISHYMDINKNEMEISLENDDNSVALLANIPVNRIKNQTKR